MRNYILIICTALAIIATSCDSKKAASATATPVMGPRFMGYFTVTQLGDSIIKLNGPTINIDSQKKRITGFAGCNSYNAAYTSKNGKLEIIAPLSTKKMCAAVMTRERTFLKALPKANFYTLEKSTLKLYDKDKNVLLQATPTSM